MNYFAVVGLGCKGWRRRVLTKEGGARIETPNIGKAQYWIGNHITLTRETTLHLGSD